MKITPKMEELVLKVIEDIEKNQKMPWNLPWFRQSLFNWKSKRPYHGINVISLAYGLDKTGLKIGQFLTYNQAQKEGAQVKKGSHGFPVSYFSMIETKKEGELVKFPLMKTSIVFGIEQVEGITPRETPKRELTPNQLGEKIISLAGAEINENGATQKSPAYYSPKLDTVSIPSKHLYVSDEAYYSTVFHELIHWTGNEKRLKRIKEGQHHGENYAFEELVAEMGASFLASFIGFAYDTQHSAYLGNWAKMFKDKKDTLYKACSQAQKACDYILKNAGLIAKEENKEEEEKA